MLVQKRGSTFLFLEAPYFSTSDQWCETEAHIPLYFLNIYLGNGMNNFKMETFTFSKRTTLDSWKKSGIQHIKMCVTHWRWKAIINSRPKIQSGILRWNYENGRFHNLENDMQVCPIFYKLNKIYAPSTNSNVLLNLQSVCSICNNNISLYLIILSLQSSVVPKIIHYQRERRNF